MAHRKEEMDEIAATKPTWHGLENLVKQINKKNNPLRQWDVKREFPRFDDGVVAPWSALRCSDNGAILGKAVEDSYGLVTTTEFCDFIDEMTEKLNGEIASAGSVRNRGRIFSSIELPELSGIKIDGDKSPNIYYLSGISSFDQSARLTISVSGTRSICDNTVSINLNNRTAIWFSKKHTKNVSLELPDLGVLVENAILAAKAHSIAMQGLIETKCDVSKAERITLGLVWGEKDEKPSPQAINQSLRIVELFNSGAGNNGETLYDLFNGATEYYTKESSGGKNLWKQINSSSFGSGHYQKQRWLNTLTEPEKLERTLKTGDEILSDLLVGVHHVATPISELEGKEEFQRLLAS